MAQVTTTVCDKHNDVLATYTRELTIDGQTYSIDVCEDCDAQFEIDMAPWISASLDGAAPPRRARASSNGHTNGNGKRRGKLDPKKIREWAAENGVEVNAMGKIRSDVIDAYRARSGSRRGHSRVAA